MRLNVMLEGQENLTYADLLGVARQAERLGFDGLYRSDHYATPEDRGLAATDAWATLAGLARDTTTLRLGTLVSPATFRPAANLAKVVATVAAMAGTVEGAARIELGMGTGWMEMEHRQYGFPFEDLATRFDRLEEHLQVVRGLWDPDADPFSFAGRFEHLDRARFRPAPVPAPRLLVGGRGRRRTPALAARFADELNTVHLSPADCADRRERLDQACVAIGRDPASVGYSLMTGLLLGADEADLQRRADRLAERVAFDGSGDALRSRVADTWLVGTPAQLLERLAEYGEARVERIMLQHFLVDEEAVLELLAAEVLAQL